MTFEIPEKALRELEAAVAAVEEEPETLVEDAVVTGRYFGEAPTATEAAAGAEIERENAGPLKPGSAGHRALAAFESFGDRRVTAYEASYRATGDYHALRREATRLFVRGFLAKDGILPNPAPRGREHVDAYRLTDTGRAELDRLGVIE